MDKKKIGFVIGSLSSGGAERVISTLSNELIEKFHITIVTFVKCTPFYKLDERVKVIACEEVINDPTTKLQSILLNYKLAKGISRILKKEQVNVTIGFITSANILAVIASKINRIPCIISERNNPMIEDVPKLWVLLRKYIYPLANKVILQTEGVKKFYENSLKEDRITILPNPISSKLTQMRDDKIVREKTILSVGRLDNNKRHDIILKAFKNIKTDWKVLIVGEGPNKEVLKEYIDKNNLSDKITIISKVQNIQDYYNKAGVFVFTSRTEGFPNALLEAMHYGIPCISTDCNFGPSELIENDVNGYLIPLDIEDNIEILEDKLENLVKNEKLREEFSSRSKITSENYTTKKVINQWEVVIDSLL